MDSSIEMTTDYRSQIAVNLLGKGLERKEEFAAYFALYDELLNIGTKNFVIQIDNPSQPVSRITHEHIITAAKFLKAHSTLSLTKTKDALSQSLASQQLTPQELDLIVKTAVRAAFMTHPNVYDSHGAAFKIGSYRHASWLPEETFADFITKTFPQVLSEKVSRVKLVLEDSNLKSLKAWKLKDRLGIEFRRTDNLADHLLYDSRHQIVYLFHHAAYLKAHLDWWEPADSPMDVGIGGALTKGTLSPRLLAETLHSLQSVLFRYDDDKSMRILNSLIEKQGFDFSCSVHEGYKMFRDGTEDFIYTFWGERLASIHDLVRDRPPRTKFQKWIKWQTTERNFFLVGGLALIISAVVGVLSLGLSGFQAYIAWQAWKIPSQPSS